MTEQTQQQEPHSDAQITDQDVDQILKEDQASEAETVAAIDRETPAEGEKPAEGEPGKPQVVPVAVHIRERQKWQQERAQWVAERNQMAQQQEIVNQRLAMLWQAQQQANQPPPPDPETDPIGANMAMTQRTAAEVAEMRQLLQERFQQEQAMVAQQQAVVQVSERVRADEEAFKAERPDYMDAVQHARDMKYREYVAVGLSHEQATQKLRQDAWALAVHAQQQGISVAEYAYQLAQALGYQPKSGASSPAANVVKMRADGQRMQSGGSGGKAGGPMTFAELASMSPEEFAKATSGDNWKRIAGG